MRDITAPCPAVLVKPDRLVIVVLLAENKTAPVPV